MTALARYHGEGPAAPSTRLQERLYDLAIQVPRHAPADLAAVFKRIDETILPRALTLTARDGRSLRLLVSNRRLMRVETTHETTAEDDAPVDPEAAAAVFARRLQPLLGDGQKVEMACVRYSADAFFWNVGCSAGLLAKAMGAAPARRAVQSLESLLQDNASARAEVSSAGQVLSRSARDSVEPVLAALLELVAGQAGTAGLRPPSYAGCTFLPAGSGWGAMIAARQDGLSLAIVPAALRDQILQAWQAANQR